MPQPVSHIHAAPVIRAVNEPLAVGSEDDCFVAVLTLPLSSNRLSQPPSREACDAAEQSNASFLGFLLQEVDVEAMPRPADERLATALAPLQVKLDMLIDMTARLSYRDVELPPICEIELGPTHMAWSSKQHWHCGEWARMSLYFHPTFREPICLFGRVTECVEQSHDNRWRVAASLSKTLGNSAESLARLALLTRRRQQSQKRPFASAVPGK
jgi:hypothetical protein